MMRCGRSKISFRAAEDLQNSKKAVLKLSNAFQTTVDDLGNILTPTQLGKFLILIDKVTNGIIIILNL